MSDFTFDQTKDLDLTFDDGHRKTRIIKEDGLVKMGQTFHVGDAVRTVEKMNEQVRTYGFNPKAETRVAAVLHEGMLQEIANRHGITVVQLISDKNYEDLLWAEGTGRDYSKMQLKATK